MNSIWDIIQNPSLGAFIAACPVTIISIVIWIMESKRIAPLVEANEIRQKLLLQQQQTLQQIENMLLSYRETAHQNSSILSDLTTEYRQVDSLHSEILALILHLWEQQTQET